jgi:hypothetical protein
MLEVSLIMTAVLRTASSSGTDAGRNVCSREELFQRHDAIQPTMTPHKSTQTKVHNIFYSIM